jgi:DNA-binding GntR family transcriptional regulator
LITVGDIDHEGPVPVYQQLANILRGQIMSGKLPAGRPVPSERTLVQTYGVAVGTIKKAIQLLRDEGLVYTVIGRGIYVAQHDQSQAP